MSLLSPDLRADARRAAVRAVRIEKQLKRYPKNCAAATRRWAGRHSAYADLALSFPGLLFVIAAPSKAESAQRAAEAVAAGANLRDAAKIAGLPMWLRGLPPEAFAQPLSALPDGRPFALHIANHLPAVPNRAALWLACVMKAARWGDEETALWVARELGRDFKSVQTAWLEAVCLWAWFSQRPETKAGALASKRWSPRMQFNNAVDAASEWILDVEVACALGPRGVEDGWLQPATIGELTFAPLLKAPEIILQARRMSNCVRTYGASLRDNQCRLWGVWRADKSVATFELGVMGKGGHICLIQARARQNDDLAPEIDRAIHEWLRSQPLQAVPPSNESRHLVYDRAVWRQFWRPYWIAKRGFPEWLPLSPHRGAFRRLRNWH